MNKKRMLHIFEYLVAKRPDVYYIEETETKYYLYERCIRLSDFKYVYTMIDGVTK